MGAVSSRIGFASDQKKALHPFKDRRGDGASRDRGHTRAGVRPHLAENASKCGVQDRLDFHRHTCFCVLVGAIANEDTDVIDYFAYGSNMNLPHFEAWLRRFGVQPDGMDSPRRVSRPDYRLRTNYLTSSSLGAANVEPSPGDAVEGLLLAISPEALEALGVIPNVIVTTARTSLAIVLVS